MKRTILFISFFMFLWSGVNAKCSTVPQSIREDYASGMFEAFITQSYGKSTIAFYQFDTAREAAKKAGENPLRLMAIERLFAWYRMYGTSLHLYNKVPTGNDRIIGEYKPCNALFPLAVKYESEWGNSPEQARLIREFILGIGEIIAGIFCATVSSGTIAGIAYGVATDGVLRIYSSLNSVWALHQTELIALQEWENTALKPAMNQ